MRTSRGRLLAGLTHYNIDYCKSQQSHNNLDPTTYRYGAVSGKTDSPRGYFEIPTWRIFIFHVGKKKLFGGIK